MDERRLSVVLSEFARTLVTDFPIQGLLDHLVKRIIEVLPITSAGVTLIAPGMNPHYISASDDAALRFESLQTDLGEGPCLMAYTTGELVNVPELAVDSRFPNFGPPAVGAGLAAVFSFPLHQDDTRLGALDLYRDTPGELAPDDLEAAQTLADVAAAHLTNVQARADARVISEGFRQSALHDALTGLPNRLLLNQRLEHAAQRGQRSHTNAAVLFVDLDRFKQVNDLYGHLVGDQLLIAVSHRLAGLLRPGDTLARVSGDEFVILCEDLQEASYVEVLGSRIDSAFSFPFHLATAEIRVTASVGIAYAGRGEHLTEELIAQADSAMYQAKTRGGASHHIIDLRGTSHQPDWRHLERDLLGALTAESLEVHYQPVVRSADGLLTGVEALLRWPHPHYGQVPPQKVVALAEADGLISQIGAWVFERACRDRLAWVAQNPQLTKFEMSVNVSTIQLVGDGFAEAVAQILQETGTRAKNVVLEMTESIFIEDDRRSANVLAELRRLGVGLSLDDFGSGYSSLGYLRSFPVDAVKIDQMFLTDLGRDPVGAAVLAAVTDLAHVLQLQVTAEGVESQYQRDEVAKVGCEYSQGFYYARPMPADAFSALLDSADGKPIHLPIGVND
jgi:diguanylate cyclase (GGDEF)-like protein